MTAKSTIQVRFYELDPYGHVNHGVYLNYFEAARVELLEELGFGLDRLKREGFHVVVVEATIRYHAPALAGDRLQIQTEVADVRRASSRWQQTMTRDGERIATISVRAATTDLDGQPIAGPAELREALNALRDG